MNNFLILVLLILSLSDASVITPASRPNKRAIKESEDDNEDLTEIPEIDSILFKRSKIDPNAKVKLFVLSPDVLAHIGTFLENPFENFSSICSYLRMVMKSFTPNLLLKSRTKFGNVEKIPVSRELARLIKIDSVYLDTKADQMFFPGSVFLPESPVTVAYALNVIETRISSRTDQLKAVYQLFHHLTNLKEYESILVILRTVPGLSIPFTLSKFFTDLLVYILKSNNFNDFHVLKNSCSDKLPFFTTFASLPVSFELFYELVADETLGQDLLSALAASCSIILPFSLTEEEESLIKDRNLHLISLIEDSPEIIIELARLCTNLRYSASSPDVSIPIEFLNRLYEHFEGEMTSIKLYHEIFAVIALMRGYKNIFKQLITSRKVTMNSEGFAKLLLKSPEFLKLVSPSQFKKHFGIKNQVLLFKTGKIGKITEIKNINERIRVMSCFMEPEEFIGQVQVLYETFDFSISNLIENLIEKSKGDEFLAKSVHLILKSFQKKKFTAQETSKLSIILGNPKYLKSLTENEEFLILPSQQIYILINGSNFRSILKLSSALKQEKAKDLRERFLVKWLSVFREVRLFPHEIEKFFDIFDIKIGNFNFSTEFALTIETILKDSRILFKSPQLMGEFVDLMLIDISARLTPEDLLINSWHKLDQNNPFLLKIYPIYKLWCQRNIKSFLSYARSSSLIGFYPEIPKNLVNEAILEADINILLVVRLLLFAIPLDQRIEIKLKSVQELRIFFFENVVKISSILRRKDNYKIVIDWDSIIEDSVSIIDYEIILTVINHVELMELLRTQNRTEKFFRFIKYFMDSCEGRNYTEINRHLIK